MLIYETVELLLDTDSYSIFEYTDKPVCTETWLDFGAENQSGVRFWKTKLFWGLNLIQKKKENYILSAHVLWNR